MYDTHTVFLMFERGVQAIVPRGSRKCRKAMRKMDAAFTEERPENSIVALREMNADARAMLRVRCKICPHPCKGQLLSEDLKVAI